MGHAESAENAESAEAAHSAVRLAGAPSEGPQTQGARRALSHAAQMEGEDSEWSDVDCSYNQDDVLADSRRAGMACTPQPRTKQEPR